MTGGFEILFVGFDGGGVITMAVVEPGCGKGGCWGGTLLDAGSGGCWGLEDRGDGLIGSTGVDTGGLFGLPVPAGVDASGSEVSMGRSTVGLVVSGGSVGVPGPGDAVVGTRWKPWCKVLGGSKKPPLWPRPPHDVHSGRRVLTRSGIAMTGWQGSTIFGQYN